MTVKELIEKLSELSPTQEVVVLVGLHWGELTIVDQMGTTVILEAEKKNTLEK